ncbi:MAG: LapA family protein [Rhodobacteraceae bacterium]|nr:LapA family protein [Paracoccaceae bacterium]
MRYIRYGILAVIGALLITVALANRGPVTLQLLPGGLAELLRFPAALNSVTLPLFLVIFAGIVAGVLLGFVWEWLREHKHRAEAARGRRETERLGREVSKMRTDKAEGDEVLALLEEAGPTR